MFRKYIHYYRQHNLKINMIAVNAAISVIPLIILGVIAYNVYLGSVTDNMSRSIEMGFQQINGRTDEYFSNMNNLSTSVFFNKTVLEILEKDPKLLDTQSVFAARGYFASVSHMFDSLRGIYIITNEGRQVGTGNFGLGEGLIDFVEENSELIEKSNGLMFFAPGSIEQVDLSYIIAVRQIRFVDSFRNAGIGILVLDRHNLVRLVESTYQLARIKVFIFDSNNKLVAATDENDLRLLDFIKNTYENGALTVDRQWYYVKQTLQSNVGWRFVAAVPTDELYREGNILKYTIILIVLAILSLTVTATMLFNISIGKQIRKLSDAFDRVASGDLRVRLSFKAKNEITLIGNNFNIMVSEIKALTRKTFTTQQRLYEAELEKTAAELYGLQSQINSHFLYNTLGSIRGMARAGAVEEVDGMISELVSILRYATGKEEIVTLENEIEHLRNYINIQSNNRKLKFVCEIDGGALYCCIPKLALQPIVENSVMHGFKDMESGLIKAAAKLDDGKLVIKVFDNGEGMSADACERLNERIKNVYARQPSDKSESGHIGLINIEKRIRATYGNEYGIRVKSWQGVGTVVIMTLPCRK